MSTEGLFDYIFPELNKMSEDERIRKALIKFFTLSDDNADYQCCGVHYKDIVAWLERQAQKPVAWSEEDKKMLKWVIGYLHNKILNTPISEERTACKNAIAWLDSLKDRVRPQSQWKPSDEQMEALWEVYKGGEEQATLASLYSDLKKLKRE